MKPAFDLSLYIVLDPLLCAQTGMVETARASVAAGATIVQLRDKQAGTLAMTELARELKKALAGSGARLIVNDDVEAAVLSDADGLHIGQNDLSPERARGLLGPDLILGVSVETVELGRQIDSRIVDYAGVGPVFATSTKPDHKTPIGFDGLAAITSVCPVPTVAIGGLKQDHVRSVFAAGAHGLAVVSAICGTPQPFAATRDLKRAISEARS